MRNEVSILTVDLYEKLSTYEGEVLNRVIVFVYQSIYLKKEVVQEFIC